MDKGPGNLKWMKDAIGSLFVAEAQGACLIGSRQRDSTRSATAGMPNGRALNKEIPTEKSSSPDSSHKLGLAQFNPPQKDRRSQYRAMNHEFSTSFHMPSPKQSVYLSRMKFIRKNLDTSPCKSIYTYSA